MAEGVAGGMSLGTLTVQLAADVSALRKEFNKAFRETEKLAKEAASIRVAFDKAFGGVAHVATRVAGNLNQVGESINKVFGENGIPQAREFARSMGLTDGKIKGLETSLKGLSGVFSTVAMAAGLMSAPMVAGIAAVAALILLVGALKIAFSDSFGGMGNFAKSVWGFISDSLETAAIFWIDVFAGVRDSIVENFRGVFDMYADMADAMAPIVGEKSAAFFKGAANYAVNSKGKSGREFMDDFKAGGGIGAAADAVVDLTMGLASSAADGIKQSWNAFGGPLLKDLMSGLMEAIPEAGKKSKALDAYGDAEEKRLDKLQKAFEKIAKEEEAIRRKEVEARERAAKEMADALRKETEARQRATESAWGNVGAGRFGSAYLDYQRSQGISGSGGIGTMAVDMVGGAAAGGKYTGAALSGAAQGGSSGGPWGAVIGAVIGLLTQSEGFAKALEALEGILGPISNALGRIIEPVASVFGAIGSILDPILDIVSQLFTFGPYLRAFGLDLTPVIKLLKPIGAILSAFLPVLTLITDIAGKLDINMRVLAVVFNAIANVLKLLESAVNWAVYGIQYAYNWIIDQIADVLDWMGADDWANSLRGSKADAEGTKAKAKAAFNEFADAWTWDKLLAWDETGADATEPLADLGGAASTAAAGMREFGDALTNLPSGYKIALARFNATNEIGGGAVGGTTSITINVNGGDAGETWKQIKKHMRRDGFLEPAAFAPVAG